MTELQARVAELAPYPDRLAQLEDSSSAELRQLRDELEERRSENERLTASLERQRAQSEERESSQRRDLEARAGDVAGLEERLSALEPLRVELGAARVRIEELEGRLEDEREQHRSTKQDSKAELEGLRKALADREEQTKDLAVGLERSKREAEKLLSGADTQTVKREGELARLQARIDELEPLRARVEELEALEEELEVYAERTEKLEANVVREKEKLAGWKDKEKERREEVAEFKSRFNQVSGSHKKLQLESDRLRKRLLDLEEELSGSRQDLKDVRGELREQVTLNRGLESQLKKASASKPAAKPKAKTKKAATEKDDLQKLSGVGPVLEKKLNRLGFRTYADIAQLDRDGVETLAEKLATSAQRIRRDKWQATARREHKAKYGSALA